MDPNLCLEAPGLILSNCDASNPNQKWARGSGGAIVSHGEGGCITTPGHHPAGPAPPPPAPPQVPLNNHSIAVQINGNDHCEPTTSSRQQQLVDQNKPGGCVVRLSCLADVVDTIIWQYTHLGVEINGAANFLDGVHAWGSGTARFTYLCAPVAH